MDKRTIVFLRNKFPKLFDLVARTPWVCELGSQLDWAQYAFCMARQKPYFGTVVLAGQTWEERKPFMKRLVEKEIKGKSSFRLLEIGSWAGSSAVLWADTIKKTGCPGVVLCVDAWQPYLLENKGKVHSAPVIMNKALKKDRVLRLFLHNVKASRHDDMIFPIKGNSDQVLPLLQEKSLDMVYVDGDHTYSAITRDLQNASRLLKEGGILSGDDYDVTVDQIDLDFAKAHKEYNGAIDPLTKRLYHPGVCLALTDFFGKDISSYGGFWAMRKHGKGWQKVSLGQ